MERTVLIGALTWVGGVGAWAVGAGYALAQGRDSSPQRGGNGHDGPVARGYSPGRQSTRVRWAPELVLDDDGTEPQPVEAEVIGLDSLAAPPDSLGKITSAEGSTAASAGSSKELTAAEEEEVAKLDAAIEDIERRAKAKSGSSSISSGLELRRPEGVESMGELMTESQRRRLAPIKSLKRVRRSRKIRRTAQDEQDFVPLVPGARATTEEAILNSFTGETTEQKREQGEDYWVDPDLVQVEQSAKQRALKVREEFVKGKDNFQEERLRQEIVAPYKKNVIGVVTVSVGVVAVIVSMFPNLLELNVPDSIGSFPDTL